MSEYMEKFSVSRLIGAPPGYVGYEEGGQLTEAVRKRPYSVILLDEIEKAHPDVFNILLQVLDDGRLTDSKGVTVDFRNTIIIMTSNLGSQYLINLRQDTDPKEFKRDFEKVKESINTELGKFFKIEFLNRIDEIIIFNPLSINEIKKIVKLLLEKTQNKLAQKGFKVNFSDALLEKISQEGFDQIYGARPLRRFIQNNIENIIAKKILNGEITKDHFHLVDVLNDEIAFLKQ